MPGFPRCHIGPAEQRKFRKFMAGHCIKQCFHHFPPAPSPAAPVCKKGFTSRPPTNTHTSLPPYGALAGVWEAHASTPLEPSLSPYARVPTVPIYSINSFPHYVYPFTWLLCFLIPLMFIICPTGSTDFASCRASRL